MSRLYEAFCDLAGARQERNEAVAAVSQWWAAEDRQWRIRCFNAGVCYECGERLPKHEDGCVNAPEPEEEESSDEQ